MEGPPTTKWYEATALPRQGTMLPINHVWITALVIQHNLVLFARDKHFQHLPQVPRALICLIWQQQVFAPADDP